MWQMSHSLTTVSLKWQLGIYADEYDTDSENDFSDRKDEDITPIMVSKSGRPIRGPLSLDF